MTGAGLVLFMALRLKEYGISARLTFSNSLLEKRHLSDQKCNQLCAIFEEKNTPRNGVIIHSDLLMHYLKKEYPGFYFVSSTTKVLTDFQELVEEINRDDFLYVVPDLSVLKILKIHICPWDFPILKSRAGDLAAP